MAPTQRRETSRHGLDDAGTFIARYFWVILKNVIGWVLILLAPLIGFSFPGPLGLPLFLIGFAMVTFPGKRRLTTRMLSGRKLDLSERKFRIAEAATGLLLPILGLWLLARHGQVPVKPSRIGWMGSIGMFAILASIAFLAARWFLLLVNVAIGYSPRVRRKVRPWLRRYGVHLLPPRRQRRRVRGRAAPFRPETEEILEIDERQKDRVREFGSRARAMVKPIVGSVITILIFVWMFRPIVRRWDAVRDHILATSPLRFFIAAAMFATFLFVFRVVSWRAILKCFGHTLPVAAATRIWSTSELARYIPGAIWQVVGRGYLAKPYGVSGATSSTSQVLELTIFLLSNVIVALGCLPWYSGHMSPRMHHVLYGAAALAPLLLLLLHPKIFYGGINGIMRLIRRQPIAVRVPGTALVALVAWAITGLVWQGLAIWTLMGQRQALGLEFSRLGLVVGAYCLAWCAGFLAVWAPGGIGVRELVLVWALEFALPPSVASHFSDPVSFRAFLDFLSVLLRLWTIAGEIILATIAYTLDYRGAFGLPDAPGRNGNGIVPPAAHASAIGREDPAPGTSQGISPAVPSPTAERIGGRAGAGRRS